MSKKVVLIADSTCDLSADLIEKYEVVINPLHVVLDDVSYNDGVDIQPDDIYRTYAEKKILPKTAAVSMGEFSDLFASYTKQGFDVVHINLGSGLSVTHNNARLAASEMEGVYVVDSCNLSTGSGLLVIEAAKRVVSGMPAAQIAEEVQALASKVSASFVLDTLEFLHKGGRCSSLAMMGANMLQLKPCIEVDNTSGKMGVGKKYRGTLDKCLQQYVKDRLEGRTDIRKDRIFITHSGISEERINLVKAEVEKYQHFDEILITRAGCTVSSHCGPNTLGILFMTK